MSWLQSGTLYNDSVINPCSLHHYVTLALLIQHTTFNLSNAYNCIKFI